MKIVDQNAERCERAPSTESAPASAGCARAGTPSADDAGGGAPSRAQKLLEGAATGVAVFDTNHRLVACNSRYRDLLELPPEESSAGALWSQVVMATLTRRHSPPDDLEAALSAVRTQLRPGVSSHFRHIRTDGTVLDVRRSCGDDRRIIETVVMAEVDPALADGADAQDAPTRAPSSQSDLARARLDEALAAMADGFALFDANDRLIAYNQRFIDYSPNLADLIAPGASFEGMLRRKIKAGVLDPGDMTVEEYVALRLARHRQGESEYEIRLDDGRVIHVQERATRDGGVVSVRSDITAMRQREEDLTSLTTALARKSSELDSALQAMSDGFALFDPDDRLILFNRNYTRFKPEVADLIREGVRFETLIRAGVERGAFDLMGMSAEEYVQWRMIEHRAAQEPHEYRTTSGVWVLVHEQRTDEGYVVGTRTDITELKEREAAYLTMSDELQRKNVQFDMALSNMNQGLCMFDAQQRLLVSNSRFLEMFGLEPDDAYAGITMPELVRCCLDRGTLNRNEAAAILRARAPQIFGYERSTVKLRLSNERVIAVISEPIPGGGSIATYHDVSEAERAENRLREYAERLEISNRELQDFAYVASHDLQEPLRKIEAFGDRLQSRYADRLDDDGLQFLNRMRSAATRMRSLINDLLDYSRVTTKARPIRQCDLNAVLDGVLSDLQISLESTRAIVKRGPLPTIEADATQMRQLLQNLVSNALKFAKAGERPEITIKGAIVANDGTAGDGGPGDRIAGDRIAGDGTAGDGEQTADFCEIVVSDKGIGFDNRYRDRIFNIFQRLHGRSDYQGTGIGLATVRKIVERHRGAIVADGAAGVGATFTIRLPVRSRPLAGECADA